MVVLIRNTAEEAWLCGKDLLRGLERAYRELGFARYQRIELVEIGTLRTRVNALETRRSGKNRVNQMIIGSGPSFISVVLFGAVSQN